MRGKRSKEPQGFEFEWEGVTKFRSFSQWSQLTGIHRSTIKARLDRGLSKRQCLGLDRVPRSNICKVKRNVDYDMLKRGKDMRHKFLFG